MRFKRLYVIRLGLDIGCFLFAYLFAYLLRFDFNIPEDYLQVLIVSIPWVIGCRIVGFWYFGLFKGFWRYTSVIDLLSIIKATTISSILIVAGIYVSQTFTSFPRSVFILDWGILILVTGGMRFARRLSVDGNFTSNRHGKKTLLVGAGETGELLARSLQKDKRYNLIAFVDDDIRKHNLFIHGIQVKGNIENISEVVEKCGIEEVIISLSHIKGKRMREIMKLCREVKVPVMITANLNSSNPAITSSNIRSLTLEDIVDRAPVKFDEDLIRSEISGKVVMITGAGGSIGSELCRQLIKYNPLKLILFDRNELGIFTLQQELVEDYSLTNFVPIIGDIRDVGLLDQLMGDMKPQIIYHSAALKHVPLSESNPIETLKNNVFGTRCLADAACRWGVERFVLLSTDKAANPVNFMGVSKRLCEKYIKALSEANSLCFLSVRFGNVLESSGSVVPTFREQIKRGKPVIVTHPETTRYFISTSEAVQLVLQASAYGSGGEIFVLDMGDPVKIVDLAKALIHLAGLEPDKDVEILYTDLRPGEKLDEELFGEDETFVATPFEKIRVVVDQNVDFAKFNEGLHELDRILQNPKDRVAINDKLMELVPTYKHKSFNPAVT